jgi:N-formylglutamate amidohydrolase
MTSMPIETIVTDGFRRPGIVRVFPPLAPRVAVIFDSPHSGTTVPADPARAVSDAMVVKASDTHVDALFDTAPVLGAPYLVAEFPRSYLDVNRSVADMDTDMVEGGWPHPVRDSATAKRGMGLMWRYAWGDVPMNHRRLTIAEAEARIDTYWRPYHALLSGLIEDTARRFGHVVHVDCHSMPSVGHVLSPDPAGTQRPDVVLGDRDGASCDTALVPALAQVFRAHGLSVAVNDPFKGGELVAAYSDPAAGRHSVQIEINRRLYMDEDTRERTSGFDALKVVLNDVAEAAVSHATTLSRGQ